MRYCVRSYFRKIDLDQHILYGVWDVQKGAFLGGAATYSQEETKRYCDNYNTGAWDADNDWHYRVVNGVEKSL